MAEKEIDIKHLSPVEAIRTRPGMFIGGTENPNVILREAIDNAVDESFGCSTCNKIIINSPKTPEDYYMVADNGRGIPIIMDESGITKTKLAVTTINTGSKFKKTLDTVSVGLNGVGITCTNSLSEVFVEISKITEKNFDKSIPDVQDLWYSMKHGDEGFYVIEFNRGIEVLETAMTYDQICEKYKVEFPHGMSTIVLFRPDPQIFDSVVASYSPASLQYLQAVHKLFYKKDVHIIIDGKEPADDFNPYQFSFMKYIEIPSDKLDEDGNRIMKKAQFYVNFECDKDMAISEMSGSINSLVVNSGLHLNVVRNAYRNALKRYYNISHDYLMAGAKINVICMAGEVDFSSQTKERCVKIDGLTEWEMRPLLEDEFKKVFRANNDYFENHVTRLNEYAASLNKISTINKIKSMVTVAADAGNRVRSRIPAEVKDCLSSDRKSCSLYIVEGKSAGGSILKSRDSKTQAVIELRGVPLNSVGADLDTILANKEMATIISAIGVGVNEYFVESAIRYGKIIIAADADKKSVFA